MPCLKKSTLYTSIALFAVFLVIISSGFFYYNSLINVYANTPAGNDNLKKIITVTPGQNLNLISNKLFQEGIIKSPQKFNFVGRLKGYDKKLKAGEYHLSSSIPPAQILDILINGKVMLHRITIPEGYNIQQIASLVEKVGFGSREEFIRLGNDTLLVNEMGIDSETFEGYLFPDTYYFPSKVPLRKIIITMLKRFKEIFSSGWVKRAEELGFSMHEILTLASIIEKETGAAFERPIISSVFHNRLKKRMRLESDPTVIYGIKDFNGNLTRKNLNTITPYNTYKIKGLPPGPIASPGYKSIEAALYPDNTHYLYFVSKKNNTHKFSNTITEHNRAVHKYQLRRR